MQREAVEVKSATVSENAINHLRLLQLADSALPIGAVAHSFGLETLVAEGLLTVDALAPFLDDYVTEVSTLEALFCRRAYRLAHEVDNAQFADRWCDLNWRLSALKPARESRAASAMLGRRFLRLVLGVEPHQRLNEALQIAVQRETDVHHCSAFGLAGGVLAFDEETTALAYVQQSLAGLVSACQRLLPLGQSQASMLLWNLKPVVVTAVARSADADLEGDARFCFTPLIEMGGMRHPMLHSRLFMS